MLFVVVRMLQAVVVMIEELMLGNESGAELVRCVSHELSMAENEAEVKREWTVYQLTSQVASCAPAARAARLAATAARSAARHSAAMLARRESEAYTPWELKRIGCLFMLLVWQVIGGIASVNVHLVRRHMPLRKSAIAS